MCISGRQRCHGVQFGIHALARHARLHEFGAQHFAGVREPKFSAWADQRLGKAGLVTVITRVT